MTATRLSIAFLVVVAVAGAGSLAFVAADDGDAENATADESMGAAVSTFMQSSTADAGESVTTGMFVAGYENGDADRRETAVAERVTDLEVKLEGLRSDYDRLAGRTEASSIADRAEASSTAYTARLARLEAEIAALERAIDELEPRAEEVGTETETVAELRTETENLAESNLSRSGAEMTD